MSRMKSLGVALAAASEGAVLMSRGQSTKAASGGNREIAGAAARAHSRYPGCEGCLMVVSLMAAAFLTLALTLTLPPGNHRE
jgi:hypothetical protein